MHFIRHQSYHLFFHEISLLTSKNLCKIISSYASSPSLPTVRRVGNCYRFIPCKALLRSFRSYDVTGIKVNIVFEKKDTAASL